MSVNEILLPVKIKFWCPNYLCHISNEFFSVIFLVINACKFFICIDNLDDFPCLFADDITFPFFYKSAFVSVCFLIKIFLSNTAPTENKLNFKSGTFNTFSNLIGMVFFSKCVNCLLLWANNFILFLILTCIEQL